MDDDSNRMQRPHVKRQRDDGANNTDGACGREHDEQASLVSLKVWEISSMVAIAKPSVKM